MIGLRRSVCLSSPRSPALLGGEAQCFQEGVWAGIEGWWVQYGDSSGRNDGDDGTPLTSNLGFQSSSWSRVTCDNSGKPDGRSWMEKLWASSWGTRVTLGVGASFSGGGRREGQEAPWPRRRRASLTGSPGAGVVHSPLSGSLGQTEARRVGKSHALCWAAFWVMAQTEEPVSCLGEGA